MWEGNGGRDYNYGPRWYDPSIMQWTSPDTLIPDPYNPLDWNRYSYVRYNPIHYTDPSGHRVTECDFGDCRETSQILQREYSAADTWKQAGLSYDEFVRARGAYVYYMSHPNEALHDCLIDTDNYYWADTYSEYVLHQMFQPFDQGPVMVLAEQARQAGDGKTFAGAMLWFSAPLVFEAAADKGFGGGGEPKWTKQMLSRSEVIAQGRNIREVDDLVRQYGGDVRGWKKMKGWDDNGQEWHWYYHPNVGKVKVKPK